MQSEEGNPQGTTPKLDSSNNQLPSKAPAGIQRGAKTPLDFLRQNTNPNLQGQLDPAAIAAQVKEQMDAAKKDPSATPSEVPSKPIEKIVEEIPHAAPSNQSTSEGVPPAEEAKKPEEAELSPEETGDEEELGEDADIEDLVDPSVTADKKPTLRDSYKNLKAKYKETDAQLKKEKDEKEKWKRKSEEYENGTAIPQVLQEKESQLQKLTHYRDLVDLKSSEEYEEKFTKPIESSKSKLKALTDEMHVPIEEVLKASKGTEGQFNQFLSESFDVVSAMEVKNLVKGLNELEGKKVEAESAPQKHMEKLREETQRANQIREAERKQNIQNASKRSWVNTLNKIKKEGKFTALIYSDTDEKFNNDVVKPLLTHAATEYAKTINTLAENGMKDLSPELAEAIALGHLLGTSSGVVAEAAFQAMKDAEQIRKHTSNLFKFNRPSIGRGAPNNSAAPGPEKPAATPTEAAQQITQKILAQRKS